MIRNTIKKILEQAAPGAMAELFVPEHESQGHYATSVAMRLAKAAGNPPMELAAELKRKIEAVAPNGFFEKIEASPPGFLNFWISAGTVREEFGAIQKDKKFGLSDAFKNRKVMIEYTDPNPFKQFHIGHLMTNVIGESIARLHEAAGATVLRVNYQGDAGLHVAKAIWGMQELPERNSDEKLPDEKASLKKKMEFLGKAYALGATVYESPDEGAKEDIKAINAKLYAKSDPEIQKLYVKGRTWSLEYFETVYVRLGTKFDHYFFESEIAPLALALIKKHPEIFPESDGALIFRGEEYGLHTRVFVSSQGLPMYEAKELELNRKKFDLYHPDASFVVTGNEINEYFRVVKKAMEFVMPDIAEKTTHLGHGMLRLPSGKMSLRTGDVITAESLIDDVKKAVGEKIETRENLSDADREHIKEAVALAAIRYSILKQGIGNDIIFDIQKSIAFHGDSGPYLQYTYARLRSILRKAGMTGGADANALRAGSELDLVRKMIEFPNVVRNAAEHTAPHSVAKYLFEFANALNRFYETTPILPARGGSASGGKESISAGRRNALLTLINSASAVLKNGLGLLGIEALEAI